jgi:hypothetical protein
MTYMFMVYMFVMYMFVVYMFSDNLGQKQSTRPSRGWSTGWHHSEALGVGPGPARWADVGICCVWVTILLLMLSVFVPRRSCHISMEIVRAGLLHFYGQR